MPDERKVAYVKSDDEDEEVLELAWDLCAVLECSSGEGGCLCERKHERSAIEASHDIRASRMLLFFQRTSSNP